MTVPTCRSCNRPRSLLATICPHCGDGAEEARQRDLAPCRSCKTLISRSHHLRWSKESYTVNGRWVDRPINHFVPCPACGEPNPIPAPPSPEEQWIKTAFLAALACMGVLIAGPLLKGIVSVLMALLG